MQQQLQQQIRYQDRSGSQHRVQRADVVREGSYKAKLGRHMTWGSKGWPCLPPPPLPLLLMVNCSPSALVFVFVSSHLCPWPCPPPTPLMLVVNCALYALHLFSVQTLRIKTMQWWSGSDMSSYVRRLEVNPSMRLVAKKKISLVSSGWPDGIWEWSLMSSWGGLSMVQKRFSALLASISKGIGWGTTSACCLM